MMVLDFVFEEIMTRTKTFGFPSWKVEWHQLMTLFAKDTHQQAHHMRAWHKSGTCSWKWCITTHNLPNKIGTSSGSSLCYRPTTKNSCVTLCEDLHEILSTALRPHFIYLFNKYTWWIFATCCIMSIFFSTRMQCISQCYLVWFIKFSHFK
jgi:hypothetical protein